MSTRRGSNPRRCPRCRINLSLCFCDAIKPLGIASTVSLVVHVRELKLTTNTAHFVREMLPASSHFDVRGHVEGGWDAARVVERPGTPLFLFPDEKSQVLNADFRGRVPGPYHLIVPDGSWNQARKVYAREPLFHGVPTVRLPGGVVGEYKLRQARLPEWVSTYEAVAHALGVLENEEVREHLLAFFRIFVARVMRSRHDFYGSGGLPDM